METCVEQGCVNEEPGQREHANVTVAFIKPICNVYVG